MKIKLFVIAALSSLFAASLVFAEPSIQMAEDTSGGTDSMQPTDNNAPQNNDTPGNLGALNNNQNPITDSNSSNANDDMSADTATGDDDY